MGNLCVLEIHCLAPSIYNIIMNAEHFESKIILIKYENGLDAGCEIFQFY